MNYRIRTAIESDLSVICEILRESFGDYASYYTPDALSATIGTVEEHTRRMRTGMIWVAESGSQILGTCSAALRQDDIHLQGIGVIPSSRGMGICTAFLKVVQEYAESNGRDNLHLCTTPYLKPAISLYEKFGFRLVNEAPFEYHGMSLLHFRKSLHSHE